MKIINKLDRLDTDLINELVKDSSVSIPDLSIKLGFGTSVLYSRINRLIKKGIIEKFTIKINYIKLGFCVNAIVGINTTVKLKKIIYEKLSKIREISSISETAGRFDTLIKIRVKNLQTLHDLINNKLSTIEGINNTEIFIELQKYE